MGDLQQPYATKMFRAKGLYTAKHTDAFLDAHKNEMRMPSEPGRPDMIVYAYSTLKFVEVKNRKSSFNTHDEHGINASKRRWYESATRVGMEVWLFLVLGEDEPHLNPEKYMPRRCWLMPYPAVFEIEAALEPTRLSIPYYGGRKDTPEDWYMTSGKFDRYEVRWNNGGWDLSMLHPFLRGYPLPDNASHVTYEETPHKAYHTVTIGQPFNK